MGILLPDIDDRQGPHLFSGTRRRRFRRDENFTGRVQDEAELRALLKNRAENETMRFTHEDFSDYDFSGLQLGGVAFENCKLIRAVFAGADMQGMDLKGSDLAQALITPEQLASAHNVDADSARKTAVIASRISAKF